MHQFNVRNVIPSTRWLALFFPQCLVLPFHNFITVSHLENVKVQKYVFRFCLCGCCGGGVVTEWAHHRLTPSMVILSSSSPLLSTSLSSSSVSSVSSLSSLSSLHCHHCQHLCIFLRIMCKSQIYCISPSCRPV